MPCQLNVGRNVVHSLKKHHILTKTCTSFYIQTPVFPAGFSFPAAEAEVREFWKKIDAFQTSLKFSEGRKA